MSKHIDLTELYKIAEGENEFVRETIDMLLDELPVNLEHLQMYLANNDIRPIKELVHKMKSSFMLFGMQDIWPIIDVIEKSSEPEVVFQKAEDFILISKEAKKELETIKDSISK
jgi:HPt (histidine-containing phosphotransfer) domain-containing protein